MSNAEIRLIICSNTDCNKAFMSQWPQWIMQLTLLAQYTFKHKVNRDNGKNKTKTRKARDYEAYPSNIIN